MKKKLSKKSLHIRKPKSRKLRGSGTVYVVLIVAVVMVVAASLVGGTPRLDPSTNGNSVIAVTPVPSGKESNLQLKTFGYITPLPSPTISASGALCQKGGANDEPEILMGYEPAPGQSVSSTGQIKVWVTDEGAPIIAPNEIVNSTTGQITTPGDRTAKAPDGYLWEPALYIFPATAENGGFPFFPSLIKGQFNNSPKSSKGPGSPGMKIDPTPANAGKAIDYTAEYIWNVSDLKIGPGSHEAQFVIHDGDDNRGVGCVNFTVL